ncbi:MAG TPA: DUF4153 domain-containing protein, partial [Rhodobacterales bacterium]|nr:DUF4153 domain-containing protein [Rhodobacterales bacterium]
MTIPPSPTTVAAQRALFATIGAAAGLMLWILVDILPNQIHNDRLLLALSLAPGSFFAVLLAALGPLRLRDAAAVGGLVALISTALFSWAGVRFNTVEALFDSGHVLAAYLVLVTIPVPFLIAARRPDVRWQDYPTLFTEAWSILVRYAAAWVFTAIFWGVLLLSNEVLKIVGIGLIEHLIKRAPVPFVLTGLVLGIGLAVVHEMRQMISPTLLLRLLRLLTPLVFAVSLVFVIAAPINGLSGLFGSFSAATTLMAMAIAAVTLVTVTLDQTDADAASAPLLAWSARLTSLLVAVMGALALWAVWLRVGQYGLTPARVAALTGAAITLAYGLAFALAVLRGLGWMARIRRANIALALALIALAVLWLTPALNAERLSVRSQIVRFEAGKTDIDGLDLWSLAHDWGRAGTRALKALRAPDHPRAADLAPALTRLDAAPNRYAYHAEDQDAASIKAVVDPTTYDDLRAILPVVPKGASLPAQLEGAETAAGSIRLQNVANGCARRTPANAPACVAI